jgi:membrane protein YdbS with pleckstrin-like domain
MPTAAPQNGYTFPLHNDEKILLTLKPASKAAIYFFFAKLGRIFLSLAAIIALWFFNMHRGYYSYRDLWLSRDIIAATHLHTLSLDVIVVAIFLLAATITYAFLKRAVNSYVYIVTNQRVVLRYGFLTINTRIIPFNQISDVNSRVTWLGNQLGLSTVYIDTVGTVMPRNGRASNNTTRMEGLTQKEADEAMQVISKAMQQSHR